MNASIRPIFLVLMLCLSPTLTRAEEILVFAASSLATALDEIEQKFEAASDYEVGMVYAGSSTLARQIEQGAPADIFISANTDWMDHIAQAGLIAPDAQFDLLGNQLVLVAHGEGLDQSDQIISPEINLADLLDGGYLAMALVDAVPAGIYGNAALIHLDLWDTVVDRVAQFDNVRSALAQVAAGATPLGVVYRSDAIISTQVHIIGTFPADSHDPIRYPVAALGAEMKPAAAAFLDYLRGHDAAMIFTANGFETLAEAEK